MADRMKLPSEIETPLDRRAMTIDILSAEIERKNRTIKSWRIKCDELEEKCAGLQDDWNSADAICDKQLFEIRELKKEIKRWELAKKYDEVLTNERKLNKKSNGKCKAKLNG